MGTVVLKWPSSSTPELTPNEVTLGFEGHDSLKIDVNGWLRIYQRGRWISLNEAMAYQMSGDEVVPVAWTPEYVNLEGTNYVRFTFGAYNPEWPLILQVGYPPMPAPPQADPRNLTWSTYVGGNAGDELTAVDSDASGNPYVCGYANDMAFPVGTPYQAFPSFVANFQGTHDAVAMKFDKGNKQILWATYFGGTEGTVDYSNVGIDHAKDISVYKGTDASLNYAFVTGSTGCNDFPTYATPATAFTSAVNTPWAAESDIINAAFVVALSQEFGFMDWGHTLGAGTDGYWSANGMSVSIANNGRLGWVGQCSQVPNTGDFDFPYTTPAGAFTQQYGGGYMIYFAADFQYEWATPFGTQCSECRVNDVAIRETDGVTYGAIVGAATENSGFPIYALNTYAPTGFTGFFQSAFGGGLTDAYMAYFDMNNHQLKLCTRWGGIGSDDATGVMLVGSRRIFVSGGTASPGMPANALPGSGGIHDVDFNQPTDGFLLDFDITGVPPTLIYGTYVGGDGYDILNTVEGSPPCESGPANCDLYIGGFTTDPAQLNLVSNPVLYNQTTMGNDGGDDTRDGFFMGINFGTYDSFWGTLFGGTNIDKGYGLASTGTELYLVGGTRSSQSFFPLKEWDLTSPLDWYDGDIFNNTMGGVAWYPWSFDDFDDHPLSNLTDPFFTGWTHDGYIASFNAPLNVGLYEAANEVGVLLARPTGQPQQWWVDAGRGARLEVFDAAGKLLSAAQATNNSYLLDLRGETPATYLVRCTAQDKSVSLARVVVQ